MTTSTDTMTIRTNNVPRPVLSGWELTAEERKEFDYLDWAAIEAGEESASFFRYRGQVYDLGEFCRIVPMSESGPSFAHRVPDGSPLLRWSGIQTDSYFSGIVVRYVDDFESVIVGRVTC